MLPKRRVRSTSGKGTVVPIQALHVWRIENYAIQFVVAIRKPATVNARLEVCGQDLVFLRRDAFPEHALAEGHVRHLGPTRNVQAQYMRKDLAVIPGVCRENQFRGRSSVGGFSFCLHSTIMHNPNAYASVFSGAARIFFCPTAGMPEVLLQRSSGHDHTSQT